MSWDAIRPILKKVPGARALACSSRGQALRHRIAQHFENRTGYIFTQFYRAPAQLDALCGPVLDYLDAATRSEPLRIVELGCSTGAASYTIASELMARHPEMEFTIDAYDISAEVLATARNAAYPMDWVHDNPLITPEFVAHTFERNGDMLRVRPAITARVRFHQADATDADIRTSVPSADIVIACNVMCNLRRGTARALFRNAAGMLKSRAALFVDGMDLDMRIRLARKYRLAPLTFELRRIHDEARLVRGDRYPWFAAGLEPFSPNRRNLALRYATVFLRGAT